MGALYPAMSVWTYLGKRWNDAYGEGKLGTWLCHGYRSRRIRWSLSFAAEEDPAGKSAALRGGGYYFLYTVGCGPFSSVLRSQIMPSRV
jgi:hypothetical protein